MTQFDEAPGLVASALQAAGAALDATMIRDVTGRIGLVLPDSAAAPGGLAETWVNLASSNPYINPDGLFIASEFFGYDDLRAESDRLTVLGVSLVEQTVTGNAWSSLQEPRPNAVALYSFKGGVGRSTMTTLLAYGLSRRGQKVLVVDLDVESPGVGDLLLPPERRVDLGVSDLLLGASTGAMEGLLRKAVGRSPLGDDFSLSGEVLVCAAAGAPSADYHYLARVNRIYADLPPDEGGPFSSRLTAVLDALRDYVEPDVMLLDSRAGLHDFSAVTLTQYAQMCLLFARDSHQHWDGYRSLFDHWARHPDVARAVRERLKIVSGLTPLAGNAEYLESFVGNAYAVFLTLYDTIAAGDPIDTEFHPALSDESAPHFPMVVPRSELLELFKPNLASFGAELEGALLLPLVDDWAERVEDLLASG